MRTVEGCAECKRISAKYEAATLEWFRVQSQLGIAEFLHDSETSARIVKELSSLAKRRQSLREAADRHLAQAHTSHQAGGSQ
jgi:hypothetical protein